MEKHAPRYLKASNMTQRSLNPSTPNLVRQNQSPKHSGPGAICRRSPGVDGFCFLEGLLCDVFCLWLCTCLVLEPQEFEAIGDCIALQVILCSRTSSNAAGLHGRELTVVVPGAEDLLCQTVQEKSEGEARHATCVPEAAKTQRQQTSPTQPQSQALQNVTCSPSCRCDTARLCLGGRQRCSCQISVASGKLAPSSGKTRAHIRYSVRCP